jgi:toxin ParE1/3/4
MANCYSFHPEALEEYAEATRYYLREASARVAERFVTAVEAAVAGLVESPTRWPIVEAPAIRRYLFRLFPYVIYFRWEPLTERVTIYAVTHSSREPGYWRHRIEASGS